VVSGLRFSDAVNVSAN